MRKYSYPLTTDMADTYVDNLFRSLVRKIMTKGLAQDEQHKRLSDMAKAIENIGNLKKPASKMSVDRIKELTEQTIGELTKTASGLSKNIEGDATDKQIALSEYRQQLKAALVSRLILLKAQDSAEKWHRAREVALKVVVVGGALAVGIATGIIAENARRGEDGERVHKRVVRQREKAKQAEELKKAEKEKK